jgi:transcriptional regulator of heat shock response
MAPKKRTRPVDAEGNVIPPEERWSLIDGPWEQPVISNKWKDLELFMDQYAPAVEQSNGLYTFTVARKALNDPTKDPENNLNLCGTILSKVKHRFDVEWLQDHELGGGGKYEVQFHGPKIDNTTGKEAKGALPICVFYNLVIPGEPNNMPKRTRKRATRQFEDYEEESFGEQRHEEVTALLAREQAKAREDAQEWSRDLMERFLDERDRSKGAGGDVVTELARTIADQKQHGSDASMQMFMAMMKNQSEAQQQQLQMQMQLQQAQIQAQAQGRPDTSKELEGLMRMLDQAKNDHRAALSEERERARNSLELQRQQYLDQLASLKEDRDRRERELKDELSKAREEIRDHVSRLESTRSELNTVKLEKVSAEVKATLGGQTDGSNLSGFRKMLTEVKSIQSALGLEGGSGGGDEPGDWKSRLIETATNPQVLQALSGAVGSAVGAMGRPQVGGYTPNPQLPPPQIQQLPDPAQQAWAAQQAQLEAQRQAQVQVARPAPAPAPVPTKSDEEEKTFNDIVESAAADQIPPEDFLREVLKPVGMTVQEAKAATKDQTFDQVVSNLKAATGLELDSLTIVGKEYVRDIYQFLQMTI